MTSFILATALAIAPTCDDLQSQIREMFYVEHPKTKAVAIDFPEMCEWSRGRTPKIERKCEEMNRVCGFEEPALVSAFNEKLARRAIEKELGLRWNQIDSELQVIANYYLRGARIYARAIAKE